MTTATGTDFPTGFEDSLLTLGLSLARSEAQETPDQPGKEPYHFYCPTPETHAKVLHRLAQETRSSSGDATTLASDAGNPTGEQNIVRNKLQLRARNLVDVFGWSLPVDPGQIGNLSDDAHLRSQLEPDAGSPLFTAAVVEGQDGQQLLLPRVRFSNLFLPSIVPDQPTALARQRILYAHSAFPTHSSDSVFFGPDTYRFVGFLQDALRAIAPPRNRQQWELAVDVGTGAGAGVLVLAGLTTSEGSAAAAGSQQGEDFLIKRVLGTDINPLALRFAAVNAQLYYRISSSSDGDNAAGSPAHQPSRVAFRRGSLLEEVKSDERESLDLVVSNPPYIAFGDAGATYADGGKQHGLALPLLILQQGIDAVVQGGVALLYTGVPVALDGTNPLWQGCQELVREGKARMEMWKVIDTDVFGDELQDPEGAYGRSGVGRIEVVGVALRKL